MIVPFENDTNGITKKLAKRSIESDKRRNLFIIVTIAFATALMLILSLYVFGSSYKTKTFYQGRYQVCLYDVGPDKLSDLLKDEAVEMAGNSAGVVSFRDGRLSLNVNYRDKENLGLHSLTMTAGHLPSKVNEVVVPKSYLEKLNIKPELGEKIQLDMGDKVPTEYTICGFTKDDDKNNTYEILVSRNFLDAYFGVENIVYKTDVRMTNTEGLDSDELKGFIKKSLAGYVDDDVNIIFSSSYFNTLDNSSRDIGSMLVVSLLIVIACSTVVYSLFYISVTGKIKEYGRLRVIGMTKKQIKGLVKKESRKLSMISITIGVIFGCLIGYIIMPEGWYWPNTIGCTTAAVALSQISVWISIRKPMKIASSVSPIEAVRVTSTTDIGKTNQTSKLFRKISPSTLARINFSRNHKKVALTLSSLGFTGVLLLCSATILYSLNPENMARQSFGSTELIISLKYNQNDNTENDSYIQGFEKLQQNNPLNDQLVEELQGVQEITGVSISKGCEANIFLPEISGDEEIPFSTICGLSKEMLSKYENMLLSGEMNYDSLANNHGILIDDSSGLIKKFTDYTPKIGDKVEIETDLGEKTIFTIMGIIDMTDSDYSGYQFFVPEDSLPEIKSQISNFNSEILIQTDTQNLTAVENLVYEHYGSNQNLGISSLNESIKFMKQTLKSIQFPIYGLVVFIGLFALINLANTLLTNLVSRQQELGILQSVGLSNKQLSKMLQMESAYYVFGTMIITTAVGTIGGYVLCRVFSQVGILGKLTYTFPVMPLLTFLIALVLIAVGYSAFATRYCKKQSLVERIRTVE